MIKKNKLLIGCLSLLLVLSVGYALFSETVTINGTATAKGSFDITTICTPGYSDEFLAILGAPEGITNDADQGGFENSICNVNGNVVTMTTNLLYPTARRYFTVKMTNTGSIPAIIWGASKYEHKESLYLRPSSRWILKNKETDEVINSGRDNIDENPFGSFISGGTGAVISKDGILFSDENVVYDSSRGYAGIKLNQGDSFLVIIAFEFPSNAGLYALDFNKEYLEFYLNHEFKWEQYTDSPNYESTTFDEWCFAGC